VPSADKGTVLSEGTGQGSHIMNHLMTAFLLTMSRYQSAISLCKAFLVKATTVITSSSYFINDISQVILILLIQALWNT
jgi:hypothetical protein